jgi:protocatechuate 3,4-dioxygenase beta subunit
LRRVGASCESCEGIYEGMPENLSWQTAIADTKEPGERMEISGLIYKPDGKTPAPDVILYVYHTDAKGLYSPAPGANGNARRHGHLRGWMKTNAKGEYKFTSVRPASYPESRNPQHIHPILKEPDTNEYWIDEYVFEDDPFVTKEHRANLRNAGGSGVIRLTKQKGVWIGKRDITLGLNVQNYN